MKEIVKVVFFWLLYSSVIAQELPPIKVYTPNDYSADNQNWAISQGDDNHVFIANNKGLLETNGAVWNLYPSPNETILRSVKAVGNKIYTGCYMEFGYWQRNHYNILEYTSLSDSLNIDMVDDEQFWNIDTVDGYILFQSLNRIYIYDTKEQSFKVIDSETRLVKMCKVDNSIYFQKFNDGIYVIENGREKLITDHPKLTSSILVNIFNYDNALLIQTQQDGFFLLKGNTLTPWQAPISQLLRSISIYSSIKLKNGGWALGTISNGIVIIDAVGNIDYQIDRVKGLSNNTVLSLFEDAESNIWLGLDNGINCINIDSPISIYNDTSGKIGSIYASELFNGNIYLGTNHGLYYKKQNSDSAFEFIEGTKGQVWCLTIKNGTLFCGHNEGTFIIEDDVAKRISNIQGTWNIVSIPNQDSLLLQGNYDGISVLEKAENGWSLRNKLEGFDISSRYLEVLNDIIFVSHEYKGVFKIKADQDLKKVVSVVQDSTVSEGLNSSLIKYNNNIIYAYKSGVFKYNQKNDRFEKDSVYSQLIHYDSYTSGKLVFEKTTNTLWGFTKKSLAFLQPGKFSNKLELSKVALSNTFRREIVGYENITNLGNERYLLGSSNRYLILDLNKLQSKEPVVSINTIKNSSNSRNNLLYVDKSQNEHLFKNKDNNFEFNYSVTEFSKYFETEYQYQLEGYYDNWSSWSNQPTETFKNLPHGNYTFKVRARVGNDMSSNIDTFSFVIEKPWYLSNVMVFIYILALLLFSLIMHNIYKSYYKRQRVKLLESAARKIELKELENKQQLMTFKNEKLNQDIENKNRELAISTMSLIKKNEFLNSIKEELKKKNQNNNLNPIIKIIDKNLNNANDWEFFEEAFNNADKDFLKKVKSKHPALTHNDLRLCAYLRLNLSSKEIAPLLNISTRSVEVKRYRLRKKMELEHETSLTDYILQL